jgi:hypothetical protein
MELPLPIDPDFRKTVVGFWLDDIDDRLEIGDTEGAELSWKEANNLYLSLPTGCGDANLEESIFEKRVKIDNLTYTTNENNL